MADKKEFEKTKSIKLDDFKKLIDPDYSSVKLSEFPTNNHQVLKLSKVPKVTSNTKEVKGVTKVMKSFTFPVTFKYKDKKVPLFMRVGEGAFTRFVLNPKINIAETEEIKKEEYDRANNDHLRQSKKGEETKFYKIIKWNEPAFVGKYAFFSKTSMMIEKDGDFEEAFPQFVNLIDKEGFEPTEFKSALSTMEEIDTEVAAEKGTLSTPEPIDTSEQVADFVINYKTAMEEYNTMAGAKGEKVKTISAKDCMCNYMKTYCKEEYAQVVDNYKKVFGKE